MAIGKIIQAPTVNQTPLNQRNTRWAEIKGLNAPHPDTDSALFGYWFNYFWAEARETDNLSPGDQARLCEAFFGVFEKDAGGVRVKPGFDQVSDERKRSILTTLLVIGFKRVPLQGFVPAPKTHLGRSTKVVSIEQAVDCVELQSEIMGTKALTLKQKVTTEHGGVLTIGFRGDGRSYEDIVTGGGFKARARSNGQGVYEWFGFGKPWHPFGLEVYANSLFLRKGHNKDNCLHTVVSIGFEFDELVAYPLLTDPQLFPLCVTPLNQWTQTEINGAAAHKWKVRAVPATPGAIDHLEHELRIYVVRLDLSRGFGTQAWQQKLGGDNPFPEIAVDQVRVPDILAEIVLTRRYFHSGQKGDDFELYDLEFKSMRLLPNEMVLKIRFGDQFPTILAERLRGLERSAKNYRSDSRRMYEKLKLAAAAPVKSGARRGNCSFCGKPFPNLGIHEPGCSLNPAKKKTGFAPVPLPPGR